ncbi:MAG: tyrosine-type recombinase/integrase [Oligoflexia bacterium]|nr:tyrosine-type recombinase/integrase [Oligoflexia bacterium]
MDHLTGPLFTSTAQQRERLTDRSLRRRIDFYLSKACLKRKRLSAHALRATSSTLLMEAGSSLLEIQNHLGHSSPETTIRYLARINQITDRTSEKIPVKLL